MKRPKYLNRTELIIQTSYIGKQTLKSIPEIATNGNVKVDLHVIRLALAKLKNRKSFRQDGIPKQILQHEGQILVQYLIGLIQKILYPYKIPNEWRTTSTILMLNKRNKKLISIYRVSNLITTSKLTAKFISNKINSQISLEGEQQGLRSRKFSTDAVFSHDY